MQNLLAKTFVALLLVLVLLVGAAVRWARRRSAPDLMQLVGALGLLVVVLAHVGEGFRLLPAMGWGRPDTPGHYLDLAGAILGGVLFPIGYLAGAFARRAG